MKIYENLLLGAITVSAVCSCEISKDKPSGINYTHGIYIVNEGSFNTNTGSISYFNAASGTITNWIFESANQRSPGDIVQSFSVVADTSGYIVVNGSGKIEIVRLRDFKTSSDPIPVIYPRHFLQVDSNKGYLTAGSMQGKVYIIDLVTRKKADSTQVGFGPETMIKLNDQVFVANSGGWGVDSTISVLDVNSDQVVSTIKVGQVPLDMALDDANKLWVYCKGYAIYNWEPPYDLISETDAILLQVDPASGDILWQHSVGKAGDYTATPPKMAVSKEGDHIYYLRPDGVYDVSAHNPVIPVAPLITGSYYGIDVNPSDGNIYVFEASFTGNGTMKIYDTGGNQVAQGTVGIAPNGAVFNP